MSGFAFPWKDKRTFADAFSIEVVEEAGLQDLHFFIAERHYLLLVVFGYFAGIVQVWVSRLMSDHRMDKTLLFRTPVSKRNICLSRF